MVQITIGNLLIVSVAGTAILHALIWLIKRWIEARLDKSIQHEYDKKIEEYKFSQLQRQKAESVSRLFARWIKYRGKEDEILSEEKQFAYYEGLNQLSIEIALWIGDKKLLEDIMARLENKPDAKSIHELIGDVRQLILNNRKDDFDSNKVIIWPTKDKMAKLLENSKRAIEKV